VDGFVAKRSADQGAYVSPNAPVVDVVDINRVRLVANVIEKDLRRVQAGEEAHVEVDAFPGETFGGRIARLAPVLDPSTRTAEMEVEIPNPGFRLKPGMYARVSVTIEERDNALVVPRNAVVDLDGKRGVFRTHDRQTVEFRPIEIGIEETERLEVLSGIGEKDTLITTGAAALRDGDRILLPGGQGQGPGGEGRAGEGQPGRAPGGAPRPDRGGRPPGQRPPGA
jgi:RND family efflux transporter MFP subunit